MIVFISHAVIKNADSFTALFVIVQITHCADELLILATVLILSLSLSLSLSLCQ